MFGAAVFALLIAANPPTPPTGEEEDIMLIDKPELSRMELEAARYERHVTTKVASAENLAITRGDTLFVEVEISLQRGPDGPIEGRPIDVRAPREIKLAPFMDSVKTDTYYEHGTARVVYAIRVLPGVPDGRHKISATIELYEREDNATIGTRKIQHTIEVKPRSAELDLIELDRRAYLYHQSLALEAYKTLAVLHDYLRLDRVDPPPPAKRVADKDRALVDKFFHHRLRADIAASRLRAASEVADPRSAEAAIFALGSLSKRATGPAARASAIDGESNARALELAANALDELRIDEAEGMLARIRKTGTLTTAELAKCMGMLGAVYAVRSREEDARREMGRALCIDPKYETPFQRRALAAIVARMREKERVLHNACFNKLAVSTVTAERAPSDGGVMIVVRAAFGPDPRELITGGDIEVWSGGGARTKAEKIRATHDPATGMGKLEASFKDTGDLENYTGQLLLKIFVREVSGIAIADAGHPDPISVQITAAEELPAIDIPWWAYAIAAGVVVVGGATAFAIVQANRDTSHGIGPIVAEF